MRDSNEKVEAARGQPEIFAEFRKANARKFRGFLAPEYNIRCIEAAVNKPFDEGIKTERELFRELVTGPQSAAQRYAFFAERQAGKIPDVPDDTPIIPVEPGRHHRRRHHGRRHRDELRQRRHSGDHRRESSRRRSTAALPSSAAITRTRAKRGRLTMDEVEKRTALIKGSLELEDLADCDLVIEAVFEHMDVKKDVFRKLDAIVQAGRDPRHQHLGAQHRRNRQR